MQVCTCVCVPVYVCVLHSVGKRQGTELKCELHHVLDLECLAAAAAMLKFLLRRQCWWFHCEEPMSPMFWDFILKQSVYLLLPSTSEIATGKSREPLVRNPLYRTQKQRHILYKFLTKNTFLDSQDVFFWRNWTILFSDSTVWKWRLVLKQDFAVIGHMWKYFQKTVLLHKFPGGTKKRKEHWWIIYLI